MWPTTFAQRLESWATLRNQCQDLPIESALATINAWWFRTPWTAYYLHWDDRETWPDPWQLLADNVFCDVARGLGILYTVTMLERADLQDAALVEDQGNNNIVQVHGEKYILNWDSSSIVNINLGPIKTRRSVSQQQLFNQLK
jgi:hypothetical protein